MGSAFDAPPDGAVTAVAVAPAHPAVVYAGLAASSGQGRPASSLYRSEDGGLSWTPTTLRTNGTVASIAVDSRDATHIWSAVAA